MNASALDCRIRFDQKQVTRDSATGAEQITWVPFVTVWASVKDVPAAASTEAIAQGLQIARSLTKVGIRWVAGITADMRIVDLSNARRVMKIISPPAMVGRRQWLEISAETFSTSGDAE